VKLVKHFDSFLDETVNLNPSRLDLLETRTTAIWNFLKKDPVIGPLLKARIKQGSWAQKTIIKPRPGGGYDGDLLLHLDPVPDWDACEYVGKLYTALGKTSIYEGKRHRRTRCVYIDYADDCHVDLVPYVERNGSGYITNRKTDEFELTDPQGFTGWLKDQNRITNGHLLKAIRLLKHARDITYGFNVKSLIVTTLAGERFSATTPILEAGCFSDVPTTLKTVVDKLDDYLQANISMPAIVDPGGTNDRFDDRWDQDGYAAFRTRFHTLREKVDDAYDAATVAESETKWQLVFGTDFKAPPSIKKSSRGELIKVGSTVQPVTERFLDRDLGIPFVGGHQVSMSGRVKLKKGFRAYRLSERSNQVEKQRDLVFEIHGCTAPGPYTVYWKVRNTGPEAERAGALRGDIRHGASFHNESTLYTGRHWVECYIVQNDCCVARARQPVIVI
jgi:hypothetical protein